MSREIDERVVSMQFDNKDFEKNVETSLSTLDKLKQKLNLTGASKGLENVGKAAKSFSMAGVGNAVETVNAKFSALEVMGVTALANITNSAVNAGKKIVSALTIDPVKSGFSEYETQINAVQTILANTKSKGTSLDDVNKALDELNTYADQTIYNFTEMTRNIGTFTAAGVDLDKSVSSIKGIANLAAISGSTSQQASTAMYQLSQALAAGKVSLMDWNSVVNAGMGGEVFQNALKRTATQMGYNVDAIIEKYGSFRESLTQGEWLTTEVLTETLTQLSGAYSEADLIAQGYTKKQAAEIADLAKTAVGAATEVKTFTQLFDTAKEAAQSGWTQTWEIIVGDFESAKALLTRISEAVNSVINSMSAARNNLLEKVLGSPFGDIIDKINETTKSVEKAVDKVKDYGEIVDKIIAGDLGTGQARWDKLTEQGYDWAHAQNLVNEKLGDATRHATDYKEAQDDLTKSNEKASKAQASTVDQLVELSDAELKAIGFTNDEVKALRELEKYADAAGVSVGYFVKHADELDGRTLLIEGFSNIFKTLGRAIKTVGEAWRNTFDPIDPSKIYGLIVSFNRLTEKFTLSGEKVHELRRTFEGLFAALDIVLTLTSGPLKIAFKVISAILGYFDMDILSVTAKIGDAIVKFRDWIDEALDFGKAVEVIIPAIKNVVNAIKDWFNNGDLFGSTPSDILDGLVNGLEDKAKDLWNAGIELAKNLLESVKEFLGIHSPSTKFFEIGENIIDGLVNGVVNGAKKVWDALTWLGSTIVEKFKAIGLSDSIASIGESIQNGFERVKEFLGNIDWGGIISVGVIAGLLKVAWDVSTAIKNISAGFEGLGDLAEQIGKATKRVSKSVSNFVNAKALQALATSLLMLVGAIVVLTLIDTKKAWIAIGQIGTLAAMLAGLVIVIGKFGGDGASDFGKISLILLAVSGALLIAAGVMHILGKMSPDQMQQGFIAIGFLGTVILALVAVSSYATKIDNLAGTILKLSIAIGIVALVARMLGGMDEAALTRGVKFIAAFSIIVAGLIAMTQFAGKTEKVGSAILGIATAIMMMALTARLLGGMDPGELAIGTLAIAAFSGIIVGLMAATRLVGGKKVERLGSAIAGIAVAIGVMALVVRMLGGMDPGKLTQGIFAVVAFAGIVTGLIAATKLAGKSHKHLVTTLLGISAAIAVMALVTALLGMMKIENLIQGLAAVTILGGMVAILIHATKGAENCVGNLIVITVALALLATAIGVLSQIDPARLLIASASLSLVMGMFAIIVKMAGTAQSAIGTLVFMTAAMVALAGILYLLAGLPIENTLAASASLSLLLLSLSASLLIISKMSTISPIALVAVGIMTLVVGILGGILYLLAGLPVESTIAVAQSLSLLLATMTVCLGGLALIGTLGPAALVGIGSLMALIIGVGGLIVGIGALVEKFPQLETFLNTGIPLLEKIGNAIGSFFGNIVGGFLEGATSGLPEIGTSLSQFMTNLQPFITGANTINETTVENVGSLAKAIMLLTGADLLAQITSWIGGGSSFAQLGADLSAFMINAMPFIANSRTIDATAMEGAKNLADMILTLTKADLISSITSWITGGSSITDFGAQLVPFGQAMVMFSQTVAGNIDAEAVSAAANAGKIMAEMADTLPNSGGVVGWFMGENDMSSFGAQLKPFGEAMAAFSKTVAGKIDEEAVTAAANAGKMMAEMAETLPNSGGVASWFAGENDMDDFGKKLVPFGEAMVKFSKTVSGKIDAEAVTAAANAGKLMAEMASTLPNSGGIVSWFAGDNDMDDFGANLSSFGDGIAKFSAKVSGKVDLGGVTSAVSAAKKIAEMIDKTSGLDSSGAKAFKTAVDTLATSNISGLVKAFKDSSKLSSAGVDMINSIAKGVKSKASTLTNALKSALDTALKNVKSKASTFNSAGSELINKMSSGITKNKTKPSNAVKSTLSAAVTAIRNYHTNFYNAGSYLVSGLASGISENDYKVEAKARAMAKAAAKAAEDELDINSPSKVFREIGTYVPMGFAQGIDKLSSLVAGSTSDMGKAAINGASNSLSHLNDILLGDVESRPTIRPVVDLSGVKTGRDAINSLLNIGSDIGVLTNVGAISATMDRRNQNGGNEDVVSAIDKLRKGLDNVGNTTYSIGGVTVTDGDVEDAIKTLVGAIIRDGRS